MYDDARLHEEINAQLTRLAEDHSPWNATLIANIVCGEHAPGLTDVPEDADFWRHAGYSHVRRRVTGCINRRAGDDAERKDDSQVELLAGYEHLHQYYVVGRDGDEVGIHVFDLTNTELEAKAAMYRAMAVACNAHAAELDRFRRSRKDAA